MNDAKKDDVDNAALPLWYRDEVKNSRIFYRVFWPGFFVGFPATFILGHDMYTDRFVRNFFLIYVAAVFLGMFAYRRSKGTKLGVTLEPGRAKTIEEKIVRNSTVFGGGFAIGFVTFNFIFRFIS